jgi:hypothetical protein
MTPQNGLAPGNKKETVEANLGNRVKFRVTLTLLAASTRYGAGCQTGDI